MFPLAIIFTGIKFDDVTYGVTVPFTKARPLPGWAGVGLAVVALVGLVAGGGIMSCGTRASSSSTRSATVFGATIATLVLSIEDIVLTVQPTP